MSNSESQRRIVITGGEAACCLGDDLESIRASLQRGECGLKPLRGLDADSPWAGLRVGWIGDREMMLNRRYGPASALAVHLAKRAVVERGWTDEELTETCVFAGSSRGNLAGWIAPWPDRKRRRIYSASNNLHSEIASAVSIALGTRGATQMLANGCSSGLDAVGLACLYLRQGLAKRAIVVSVDLPLVAPLLESFHDSGLLSENDVNDPYAAETSGFFPAEAGAVLLLEREDASAEAVPHWARVAGYWAASDAYDLVGAPPDGAGLLRCLQMARADLPEGRFVAVCPHANGTAAHAQTEVAALRRFFDSAERMPSLHVLKASVGHSLGASGALATLILADFMRAGVLPPNLPALTVPGGGFTAPPEMTNASKGDLVLNLSVAMGGHNAALALEFVSPEGSA